MHPDASRTHTHSLGVVGYTYYEENVGWQSWFPCQMDHNFLHEVQEELHQRYDSWGKKGVDVNWLAYYRRALGKVMKINDDSFDALLFPTVEQKARALVATITFCKKLQRVLNNNRK